MNCKKGDFGGVKDRGVSIKNRKLIFYGICIWVRLGLVYVCFHYTMLNLTKTSVCGGQEKCIT